MSESVSQRPFYQTVDGFRIPGAFSPDAFRTALKYQPKKDDVFIATYPKCGTTWAQQMLYLIFHKGQHTENVMEFQGKMPFLEMLGVESAEQMNKPGAIKTHLPFSLVPYSPHAKYINIVRNPKDTLVSFYFHTRVPMYQFEDGEFGEFFELFLNGNTDFGDYFDHVLSWYEHRSDANVMFITYEEMKAKPEESIKKLAKFLGAEYEEMLESDEEMLKNVLKYSSFEYMKSKFNVTAEDIKKNMVECGVDFSKVPMFPGLIHFLHCQEKTKPLKESNFIRKGEVGNWKQFLSEDQDRRLNEKIEFRLKGTDLYSYWKELGCI